MERKTVKVSENNELYVYDAYQKGYLTSAKQIFKPKTIYYGVAAHVLDVWFPEEQVGMPIYADDEIEINNIRFSVAAAEPGYFTKEIEI